MRVGLLAVGLGGGLLMAAPLAQAKVTLQLDYTYDSNNFFANTPAAKADLERAAQVFSDRLLDDLTAITPGFGNSWTASIFHPGTGAQQNIVNPSIATDTVRLWVGGYNIPGTTLGQGGPGGYSASGTQTWLNTIASRGESGALANPKTDFGPWGGSLTFDTGTSWHYGPSSPPSGKYDFFTVAMHEIAHLLGFGTAGSWTSKVVGSNFVGPNSGVVALADSGHWATTTKSSVAGVGSFDTAMDPSIASGQRLRFTDLDFNGMRDIGWQFAHPGDANADGVVNVGDLGILASNWNAGLGTISSWSDVPDWSQADFNWDGVVNVGDLGVLASNWNYGVTTVDGSTAELMSFSEALALFPSMMAVDVPEPASLGLLGMGVLALLRRGRR